MSIGGSAANAAGTASLNEADSTTASATGAIAIGSNFTRGAQALSANGIAIGAQATVASGSAANGVAIGLNAAAASTDTVALGSNASATGATLGNAAYGVGGTATAGGEVNIANGGNGRRLTGLAAGSEATDAVNVSQLNQLGQTSATALGGGAALNAVTGAWTAPSYTVQSGTFNTVGGALGSLDSNLTRLNSDVSKGAVGVVQRSPAADQAVLTAAGGTGAAPGNAQKLSNLAAGAVSAGSLEAVNGSQLNDTNQQVLQNTSGLNALDGRVGVIEGTVNGISSGAGVKYFHASSTKADSVSSGVHSVAIGPNAHASGSGAVAVGNDAVANAAGSVALGEGTSDNGRGAQRYTGKYSNLDNVSSGTVSVGNSATGMRRTVSNVADGKEAHDAVNLQQLDGAVTEAKSYTDTSIQNLKNNVRNTGVADDKRIREVEAAVQHVEKGTGGMFQDNNHSALAKPSATGNDAVAGGAGSLASGDNSVVVGTNARAVAEKAVAMGSSAVAQASNSVALGANSLADRQNTVSVGARDNERQVTHVARGSQGTDAVNVEQLNESVAGIASNANAYTDQRLSKFEGDLKKQDDTLSAGIAGAMAMASLPQSLLAGGSMTSVGAATYRGQSAMSFGFSRVSNNGRWVTNIKLSTSTQGRTGAGAGVGYQW